MKPSSQRVSLALAAALLGLGARHVLLPGVGASQTPGAASPYSVTDRGPTGWQSFANTVNNWGHVGGGFLAPGQPTRGYWYGDTQQLTIGQVAGYQNSVIVDNNDAGNEIGYLYNLDPNTGTLVNAIGLVVVNDKIQYLPRPQSANTEPRSFNGRNQIVGRFTNTNRVWIPSIWNRLPDNSGWTQPSPFPLPTGATSGVAYDINELGVAVGAVTTVEGKTQGCEWIPQGDTFTISVLPNPNGSDQSVAFCINNLGQAGGWVRNGNGPPIASGWDKAGAHVLGTLPGHTSSQCFGINDRGQMVGRLGPTGGPYTACRWGDYSGASSSLNDWFPANSGWLASSAQDISNSGSITGAGTFNGANRAFLATPTPARALTSDQAASFRDEIERLRQDLEKTETSSGTLSSSYREIALDLLATAGQIAGKDPCGAAGLLQALSDTIAVLETGQETQPDYSRLKALADRAGDIAQRLSAATS